ncbi:hypothetical protein Tco_1006301 [Tanacetum coccineum]|uniref:Uncharacterized protein n=1 Tax=Tanacetum coccineum TaxID=301880 RepID=A0ABQ5FIB7_9ASTR
MKRRKNQIKKFNAEQEARALQEEEEERLNLEAARELQRQLNQRQEVPTQPNHAEEFDWNDPKCTEYPALKINLVNSQAKKEYDYILEVSKEATKDNFKKMSYIHETNFERLMGSVNTFISDMV